MRRQNELSWLLALCLLVLAASASAHGDRIGGLAPFLDDGEVIGAGSTWGVVLREGERWLRSCEEGSGAPPRFYHRASDGRVLVAGDAGLFSTSDGGCTYARPAGDLGDHQIGAFAAAAGDPTRLFVATKTPGRDNGVYRSLDEGRTFEATSLSEAGVAFDALLVTDDGARVVAVGRDLVTFEARVFTSDDGGASFTAAPAALEPYAFVRLLGVGGDGVTLAAAVPTDDGGNALLLSTDGFATATEVARFDDEVTAFGEVAGARLIALSRTRLLRQASEGEPFVEVEGGSAICLLRVPGDARLWACGQLPDGVHLLATADGETWEPHVPYLGVEERLCPEGTPGRERCAQYLFPDAGVPDEPDAGVTPDARERPPEEPRCACATTAGPGVPWLALLVLALAVTAPVVTGPGGFRSWRGAGRSPRCRGGGSRR